MAEPLISTRDSILDAAEALFARQGFDATTIKDIGTAAGVNAALLYYYFTDKATLYEAVLRRMACYADCDDLVLWVCSSELRRDGLRRRAMEASDAGVFRDIFLFTTVAEYLERSPHEAIWLDGNGNNAALERERGMERGLARGLPQADHPHAGAGLRPPGAQASVPRDGQGCRRSAPDHPVG